ncbi:MAG: glutamine-hydrolyzing GMP synthase [SAR324 cluster bacterium]|nr:glutamine-hydrolyzing GMP synthase [SAR324 cluster bacterium]
MSHDMIAVLDFGSQYAHLIAKRLRHLGVYTEIFSPKSHISDLKSVKGIVLSGGPASVFAEDAPAFNQEIFSMPLPILGLCYGHQLVAQYYGGKIEDIGQGEFGKARLKTIQDSPLWEGIQTDTQVWMSHQDSVTKCPPDFQIIGSTSNCSNIAMQHQNLPIYTLQFHPEVQDSTQGSQILANFAKLCGTRHDWSMETFVQESIEEIQKVVGNRKVLMFLSGGVDSSVAFALLIRALGPERILGLFINNGFLRKNEAESILDRYQKLGFKNIQAFDASEKFLQCVENLVDPEKKRKRVGAMFVQIRDHFLQELNLDPEEWMLGQGTLYPDIIESGGSEHSHTIKTHHNREDAILALMEKGHVIEPLRDLYKDEVRKVGEVLGLPESLVWRHPFPGPGLSINVLCAHGNEKFEDSSAILENLRKVVRPQNYDVDLLTVRSVGVQGDQRTYARPAVLTGAKDWEQLETLAIRITNEIRAVNRVITLLLPEKLPHLQIKKGYCTKDRLDILREADDVITQICRENDLMHEIFQILVILLPLSVTGTGDCIVLRPVCSEDVMTAQFAKIDWKLVNTAAQQIFQIPGIDAVFYDITHKPPATFGWE